MRSEDSRRCPAPAGSSSFPPGQYSKHKCVHRTGESFVMKRTEPVSLPSDQDVRIHPMPIVRSEINEPIRSEDALLLSTPVLN